MSIIHNDAILELSQELIGQARAATDSDQTARAILAFDSALMLHRATGLDRKTFVDLVSQGELFLQLEGELFPGLSCLFQAAELSRQLQAPQAGEVSLRFESIMGQFSERFPEKARSLQDTLSHDPEVIRSQGIDHLLRDLKLATVYFEDQARVAAVLGEPGGIFSSLGSQAQCLVELGQHHGAVAALILAENAASKLPAGAVPTVRQALDNWQQSLSEVIGPEKLESLKESVRDDAESIRLEAVRVATQLSPTPSRAS